MVDFDAAYAVLAMPEPVALVAAGSPEAARKAWESRKRNAAKKLEDAAKAGGQGESAPAPADEPVKPPEPPEPPKPKIPTRSVRDVIAVPAGAKGKAMGQTLDRLAALHRAPIDELAPTQLRFGGATLAKGGHFSPAARAGGKPKRKAGESYPDYKMRVIAWANSPMAPEILINARKGYSGQSDGAEKVSFLHEFGHRIDYHVPADGGKITRYNMGSFASDRAVKRDASQGGKRTFTDNAMGRLMEHAFSTPTIDEASKRYHKHDFLAYYRSPREVWARAYSQWSANRLGGPERGSLEAMQATSKGYQWPDDEFEAMMPLIEGVLREQGLLE